MSLVGEPNHELLMVGIFAETYRIGNIVKKVYRRFPDDDIATEESVKATRNEASIYILLGDHPRIAKVLHTDPTKTRNALGAVYSRRYIRRAVYSAFESWQVFRHSNCM